MKLKPSVVVPPSAPVGPLDISDVSQDSVTLSWSPPTETGGGSLTGYVITAKDVLGIEVVKFTFRVHPETTCYRVTGLKTKHIYVFRVHAENEAGMGDALVNKKPVRVKASHAKPPAPGRPLASVVTEPMDGISIKWMPPDTIDGPPITNYILEKYDDISRKWMHINSAPYLETSFLFSDAIPGVNYSFRISAENDIGISEPGEASEPVQMIQPNTRPKITMSPNCLVNPLLFECGETIRIEAEVAGFPKPNITWRKDLNALPSDDERIRVYERDEKTQLRIMDSTKVDGGYYDLTANNEVGEDVSPPVKVVVADKPDPPPSAPVITDIDLDCCFIKWEPIPCEDGAGGVTNYILEKRMVEMTVWIRVCTTPNCHAKIEHLIEGTSYKFRVRAENDYGESNPSPESMEVYIPEQGATTIADDLNDVHLTLEDHSINVENKAHDTTNSEQIIHMSLPDVVAGISDLSHTDSFESIRQSVSPDKTSDSMDSAILGGDEDTAEERPIARSLSQASSECNVFWDADSENMFRPQSLEQRMPPCFTDSHGLLKPTSDVMESVASASESEYELARCMSSSSSSFSSFTFSDDDDEFYDVVVSDSAVGHDENEVVARHETPSVSGKKNKIQASYRMVEEEIENPSMDNQNIERTCADSSSNLEKKVQEKSEKPVIIFGYGTSDIVDDTSFLKLDDLIALPPLAKEILRIEETGKVLICLDVIYLRISSINFLLFEAEQLKDLTLTMSEKAERIGSKCICKTQESLLCIASSVVITEFLPVLCCFSPGEREFQKQFLQGNFVLNSNICTANVQTALRTLDDGLYKWQPNLKKAKVSFDFSNLKYHFMLSVEQIYECPDIFNDCHNPPIVPVQLQPKLVTSHYLHAKDEIIVKVHSDLVLFCDSVPQTPHPAEDEWRPPSPPRKSKPARLKLQKQNSPLKDSGFGVDTSTATRQFTNPKQIVTTEDTSSTYLPSKVTPKESKCVVTSPDSPEESTSTKSKERIKLTSPKPSLKIEEMSTQEYVKGQENCQITSPESPKDNCKVVSPESPKDMPTSRVPLPRSKGVRIEEMSTSSSSDSDDDYGILEVILECSDIDEEIDGKEILSAYVPQAAETIDPSFVAELAYLTFRKLERLDTIQEVSEEELSTPSPQKDPTFVPWLPIQEERQLNIKDNSFRPSPTIKRMKRPSDDLIELAQRMERSFEQKTSHIEKLESNLTKEMESLERDLELLQAMQELMKKENLRVSSSQKRNVKEETPYSRRDQTIEPYTDPTRHPRSSSFANIKSWWISSSSSEESEGEISNVDQKSLQKTASGSAPKVITPLENRIIPAGYRVKLTCCIVGDPDPEISWCKNGKLLHPNLRRISTNIHGFGLCSLEIFNAKQTDTGEYSCKASNRYGNASTNGYLRVTGEKEPSPVSPYFESTPGDDVTFAEGSRITLEWQIAGSPTPRVTWAKNSNPLDEDWRIDSYSDHRGHCRLIIRDAQPSDSAMYSCIIENDAGKNASTVMVVIVEKCPGIHLGESGKMATINSSNTETTRNQSEVVSTIQPEKPVNSKEQETLRAQKKVTFNLQSSSEKSYSGFSSSPLTNHERLAPKYTRSDCEQHWNFHESKDAPGAIPCEPAVTSIDGRRGLTLSWKRPCDEGSSPIQAYKLEMCDLTTRRWQQVGITRIPLYDVYGLQEGRDYLFRVSAKNRFGWGPAISTTKPIRIT